MRRGVYVAAVTSLFVGASIGVTPRGSAGWAVNPIRATLGQPSPAMRLPSPRSSTRAAITRDNGDVRTAAHAGGCPGEDPWSQAPSLSGAVPPSAQPAPSTVQVPVLMYHHVLPPSLLKADEQFPDLYVDPARFDAQMAALQAFGWHSITARQLAAAVTSGRSVPARSVVITFDDGRPDNYTYAFPILKRYGFVATFFIVPGRIGTSRHMTACQLREIAAAGNELADHTWSHCDLTTLTYGQVRSRIRAAADSIESLVGVRPDTMAYPYGRYDTGVEAAADAEGMLMAFTTRHGASESVAGRLAEPRLRVQGLVRQPDGTYSGGTSAQGLLWLVSPYSGS